MPEATVRAPAAPLRIALLTHSVHPRGGVVHTLELGDALQALGHDVTVLIPATPGQQLFRATQCRVTLLPVPASPPGLEAMVAHRIEALVKALPLALTAAHPPSPRYDIVHAQDTLSGNALATLQAQGLMGDWVRTVHHLDDFTQPRLAAWQLRGFAHARQVCCVSDTWRERLRREHSVAAWRVHNGVNLARYTPQPSADDAALAQALSLPERGSSGATGPLCLAVGGVEARKNSHRLLRAFATLRRQQPGARLLIAGGATLLEHAAEAQRFTQALQELHLTEGPGQPVQRLGPVADALMPALFRRADVLLMPSLNEGFGLVVLEALASGTPVVVSQCAPFTEYLHGEGVHWCDPLDVPSITAATQRALQAGRVTPPAVCEAHAWEHSARQHEALYRCFLPTLQPAVRPARSAALSCALSPALSPALNPAFA